MSSPAATSARPELYELLTPKTRMSTLRNIAAHLWRGSNVRKANVVLGITGAALSAACAADQVAGPVTPSAQRAHADLSATNAAFDADSDGHLSKEEKAAQKAARDSVRQYNKAEMDSLKADWQAYKRAIKEGRIDADLLRCEPRPAVSVSKVIGPKGGVFNIGPHKFEVPAGALDSNVTITATSPTNSRAELQFEPHGLQFNKPVQMTVSYKGCIVPDSTVLGISYISHPLQSAAAVRATTDARMPARDDKAAVTVSGLTDHFSGYLVTWSRTGSGQ